MTFKRAQRLDALPPYLFADIDRRKRAAIAAGKDVINFGVGDPDQPTPGFIIRQLQSAAEDPRHHSYPLDQGSREFRAAAATWFKNRFKVELDPASEVLMLIGSKEGLAHLPLAVLNPGDVCLVPSPGYPVYRSTTIFAGGVPHIMPLSAERGWLPDFSAIPSDVARAAKLMFLNYPNNPTGAVADLAFFETAVDFARQHEIFIAQDAAYSEMCFGAPAPSVLQIPGARDLAIELHSLSKTFNMTGWRIGFAVGHPQILAALGAIKSNMDSGQFGAIQMAAVEALGHADHPDVRGMVDLYRERRDALVDGLTRLGFKPPRPQATFYLWMPIPRGCDSMGFATRLLEEANVVVIPGNGFGDAGEGYVRFALTVPVPRIHEALDRISRLKLT